MTLTKIKTDGINDDAVTKAKIPADQIEASELANDSVDTNAIQTDAVTTAKILDENITLAKLEHGTPSNDGKFLRANNGADPTFETVTIPPGIPSGGIIIWSGASNAIPTGFVICDGQNSTPDLRDRFVVGAGLGYNVNQTGGNNDITLSTAQLPSHTHDDGTLSTNTTGSHTHSYTRSSGSSTFDNDEDHAARANSDTSSTTGSNGDHSHTISGNTGSTGSGTAVDIRPQFFALCYIMKT